MLEPKREMSEKEPPVPTHPEQQTRDSNNESTPKTATSHQNPDLLPAQESNLSSHNPGSQNPNLTNIKSPNPSKILLDLSNPTKIHPDLSNLNNIHSEKTSFLTRRHLTNGKPLELRLRERNPSLVNTREESGLKEDRSR